MPNPQEPGTVRGYTPQSQDKINLVNRWKALEDEFGALWHETAEREDVDTSMLEISRERIREGGMWFGRSVFQPKSVL